MMIALFVLCSGLAWFDFKTARIPNGVTLPLLLAGVWLQFPGSQEIWLASVLLFFGWRSRLLGGGDVKLWLALLWLAAPALDHPAAIMGAVWVGTGLVQLAWRVCRGLRLLGVRNPGAWRVLPYAACLVLVS
jgi:Flp pilus assembly protein protease CpaA